MKTAIIEALDAASDGYSSDKVVADPELNRRFIFEYRLSGLGGQPRWKLTDICNHT